MAMKEETCRKIMSKLKEMTEEDQISILRTVIKMKHTKTLKECGKITENEMNEFINEEM